MSSGTQAVLENYHLGRLGVREREGVEELLLDSQAALLEYFAIKRERELGVARDCEPSPALAARLRESVRAEFADGSRESARTQVASREPKTARKPLRLASSFAFAASLACVGLLAGLALGNHGAPWLAGGAPSSAKPRPDSGLPNAPTFTASPAAIAFHPSAREAPIARGERKALSPLRLVDGANSEAVSLNEL